MPTGTKAFRTMQQKFDYSYCAAAPVLEWLGEKWNLAVLLKLEESGTMRFNELWRQIPSVSERMLAASLRSLEGDGLVSRRVYPEVPPRVEYELTPLALGFLSRLKGVLEWGEKHLPTILEARRQARRRGR